MTIRGSCLCGVFEFEISRAAGPFEICHCTRCRKRSGAAGLPMIGVEARERFSVDKEEQLAMSSGCPKLRHVPKQRTQTRGPRKRSVHQQSS